MNKKRYITLLSMIVSVSSLLTGCQSLTGYNQINKAEDAEMWSGKVNPIAGEVNISCSGTYHCEITQIDQALVIAPDTHKPVNLDMLSYMPSADSNGYEYQEGDSNIRHETAAPLLTQKSVKVVPLSASGMTGMTNYYARVKPAKREVHINFYPENNVGYIERFAMIHEFIEPDTYQLHAYRSKSAQDASSLLETASPAPLCIDLLQGDIIKRRFCKQMDTESQGEFVEISMIKKDSSVES